MEILQKIKTLSDASKYDNCCSTSSKRQSYGRDRIGNAASAGICHSYTEAGSCVALYKTLFTNSCSFDCKYCINSTKCNKNITSFKPDELAKVFMKLYIRNYVEGLFLSSGIPKDPDSITEKMVESVKILRNKYKFHGYIHFKALPGVNKDLLKQAAEFSDRVSVNLEAPNKSRMNDISDIKDYKIDILRRQAWLKRMKPPAGQTTQFVVGGADETDLEILKMTDWEYKNIELKRAYFSVFSPVKGTPLENKPKQEMKRENRLYNCDWLLRKYDFKLNEIKNIMDEGMLPRNDPKIFIARNYFNKPIDLNEATYDELIRIPGIGPLSVSRIQKMQKTNEIIYKREQLKNIGIVLKRATPFIKINGVSQKTLGDYDEK